MITVAKEMAVRAVTGDIGLEIEVEGHRLPRTTQYWRMEVDGSLKGESIEYVLAKPQTLEGVKKALEYLEYKYKENETVTEDTVRAGVHVHINCQELSMVELFNFITVYLILENLLVKWCGQYREGNLFCLRASDAEWLLHVINTACSNYKPGKGLYRAVFKTDELRYASLNLKALGDYGSLEFRAMRSTRDLNLIYKWAETLYNLREYSRKFENPKAILERFSLLTPCQFAKEALGANAELFSIKENEELIWNGMYNAQDVAYSTDWHTFMPKFKKIGQLEFLESDDPDEPDMEF